MLRITLYKNCILNETYQNVISTAIKNDKSVLERYLETLNSYQLSDLEDVYYENNGKLNFDLELVNLQDIYQYNYMKILYYDEDEKLLLKRYCFIKNIEVKNEIVYLTYEEDIFSSYSNEINKITESYLCKSRKLIYKNKNILLHTLPIEYNGDNSPYISHDSNDEFSIILKVQYYNSEKFGESSERNYTVALISEISNIEIHTTEQDPNNGYAEITFNHKFNLNKIMQIINKIYANQSNRNFFLLNSGLIETLKANKYYKIEDIAIVPYNIISNFNYNEIQDVDFINGNIIFDDLNFNAILGNKSSTSLDLNILFSFPNPDSKFRIDDIYTKNLNNNFKRISIGTFNTQIPVINNGTEKDLTIYFYLDDANYYFYLSIENSLYDITDNFIYKIPYDEINGEIQSQNRLAKSMQIVETALSLGMSPINSIKDGIKTAGSTGNTALGVASGVSTFIGTLLSDSAKLASLNSKVYTSNKGNFAISSGALNAKYGIVEFLKLSDNDNYVLKSVNNLGYNIYEYCDNLDIIDFFDISKFISDNVNYDVIQFDKINIIGNFPRTITLKLNSIFENGFKIWYNENLQDDNLGVR